MNFKVLITIAASTVFALTACNGKSPKQVIADIKHESKEKSNQVKLSENSWISPCSEDSPIPTLVAAREVYKFNPDGSFEKRHYFFTDKECQKPSYVRTEKGNINFKDNKDVNKEPAKVTFDFKEVSITAGDETASRLLNGINYCKQDSYGVNKVVDLTLVAPCTPGVDKLPRTAFDVVQVTNGQLIIGGDSTVTDAAAQPTIDQAKLKFDKGDYSIPSNPGDAPKQ